MAAMRSGFSRKSRDCRLTSGRTIRSARSNLLGVPVAQQVERRPEKADAQVRFLAGTRLPQRAMVVNISSTTAGGIRSSSPATQKAKRSPSKGDVSAFDSQAGYECGSHGLGVAWFPHPIPRSLVVKHCTDNAAIPGSIPGVGTVSPNRSYGRRGG